MTVYDLFSASKRNTPEGQRLARDITVGELAHNHEIAMRTVDAFAMVLKPFNNNYARDNREKASV